MHYLLWFIYRNSGNLEAFSPDEEMTREYLRKATGREFKIPGNLAHASDIMYKFRHEIAARASFKLVHQIRESRLRWWNTSAVIIQKCFLIRDRRSRISICTDRSGGSPGWRNS